MRNLLTAICVSCFALTAFAADPPGSIVIRPNGSSPSASPSEPALQRPVVTYTDPNRPGLIIIRPQQAGPQQLEAVVRQDPKSAEPKPVPNPMPVGVKPAEPANPEAGKLLLENWDVVYLKGQKVGYFHVTVREYERDGKKFLYATKAQKLTVARFGQVVEQWAEDATMETADGAVLTTLMRQGIGRDQKLSLTGTVVGKVLKVKIEGAAGGTQDVPWPDGVIGVAKEATLLADRKPKPGDSFDYLSYEGRLNRAVKFTATAKALEEVVLIEGQKPRKVLRVELAMEPIENFRLPPSTLWADAETFEPIRMDSDVPTLGGKMMVVRTTKEIALRPVGKVPDLFDVQSIPLDRAVPGIHGKAGVVYKVKSPGDLPVDRLFPTDNRQLLKNFDAAAKTVELHVLSGDAAPPPAVAVPMPGKEYLSSNFFIDWDNDAVKQRATQASANLAVGATDLQKARAVERWVNQNMRSTEFSQAMATCSNVAKTLSGDCTEYAMLSAGICRALGVLSRTALGLVYAPGRDGKPYLAYHMWFEVYAGDRWVALDATLGQGGVGPGHLKITDAHWHDEKSFAPLLPVLGVLGANPKIEVLKVTEGK